MQLRATSDSRIGRPFDAEEEASVVRRAAAGDPAAFEWIMRRYNRRLYRLARASLGQDAEAKDALQEAYLCAYRGLTQFRGESALATWLARIVLNECTARHRRTARRRNVVPMMSLDSHMEVVSKVADDGEPPDRAVARTQMRDILQRKLNELPESLRLVFVLRSVEELSVEETAQCLAISQESVRMRHFRAKGLLRDALASEIDSVERDLYEFGGRDCDGVVDGVLACLER
ncbi:MAG: RNA polymerase sigma factor [Bacillati bacterium ANGP1]|uniref:RNA polymerase sigma factor n=1 Tax=Candidatus Segetimicrobium genomatis TaxID=2569760 RepID=A0A537JTN9_9BACT|nr:MAG: RNA polymerase sigma factor [Terrabacteria group bacterium ANGP1]